MYAVNQAFMQKFGYFLVTDTDALWVRLLREKYRVTDVCPATITRATCTPLWRAISTGWSEFLTNIAWSIGNGRSIDLLNDTWVSSLGPLRDYSNDPLLLSDDLSLQDFIAENGTWDYNALCDLFHVSVVDRIISIKCPEQCDVDDRCMWRWTTSHTFELRSAYSRLVGLLWSLKQAIWFFLWLAYKRKLLTNAERCRCHLSISATCVVCNVSDETVTHVLRDCCVTRQLWQQLLPPALAQHFFSMNLQAWLSCNLMSTFLHPVWNLSWNLLSASLIWQFWKRRNDIIFGNMAQTDEALIRRSLAWADRYYACARAGKKLLSSPRATSPVWIPPNPGWFCLSVDGGVSLAGMGRIGGAIRNSEGDWIVGFVISIGFSNCLHAELWAVFEGLKLAWEFGFERLLIQSDSRQAVDLVNSVSADSSVLSLIRAIARLRQKC
ncbi:hypothetical protein V6N11_042725 [Hibiscus sabdariffa]|uniref:RNase H type-1 domain-containing protein n=1 Tax=Hibiscus sabdariffa TaxID=183260 RepID=A0ABR2QX68_9ROSI